MKRLFFLAVLLCCSMAIKAQYVNTTEGTKLIYNYYEKEGKNRQTDTSTVLTVAMQGDLTIVRTSLFSMQQSEKEKESSEAEVEAVFENAFSSSTCTYNPKTGVTLQTFIDGKVVGKALAKTAIAQNEKKLNRKLTEEEKGEIIQEIDGKMVIGEISLPIREAKEGETFASSEFVMNAGIARLVISIDDGKYLGTEELTTPAGTFLCTKMSFIRKVKFSIISETEYVTSWYAKGVGLVKEECRNKKGKIQDTQELIAIRTIQP